jgi:hypothetical protein
LPRCPCRLMMPGITYLPVSFRTSAPADDLIGPLASLVTRPSVISIHIPGCAGRPEPSISVTPARTLVSARSPAQLNAAMTHVFKASFMAADFDTAISIQIKNPGANWLASSTATPCKKSRATERNQSQNRTLRRCPLLWPAQPVHRGHKICVRQRSRFTKRNQSRNRTLGRARSCWSCQEVLSLQHRTTLALLHEL